MKINYRRTVIAIVGVILFWLFMGWVLLDGRSDFGKSTRQIISLAEHNLHNGVWLDTGAVIFHFAFLVVIPVVTICRCFYFLGVRSGQQHLPKPVAKPPEPVPAPQPVAARPEPEIDPDFDVRRFRRNPRFKDWWDND